LTSYDEATADQLRLVLRLEPEADTDPGEVERCARQLRTEILETDVDSVEPVVGGLAPSGAKGLDPATAEWLITLSASGGVLTTVIGAAKAWVERSGRDHRVAITLDGDKIELDRVTAEEREALVAAFVHRHQAG
jgi:hypothetical protein